MRVRFIHQAFPAQFGRLGLELKARHGWDVSYLVESLSTCPPPSASMLEGLRIERYQARSKFPEPVPWPRHYEAYLAQSEAVADILLADRGPKPDLIVAHGGRGAPIAFLREVVDCPIVSYCEYYFPASGSDLTWRLDLPVPDDVARCFPRSINAPVLLGLTVADAGYSPTAWQRSSFPARFQPMIAERFDGVDTELYRPRQVARTLAGRSLPLNTKLVTYVARGLESIRGFDIFLEIAARIARERSDVVFAVAGGDRSHYGWDTAAIPGRSFRDWAAARSPIDPDRIVYLGVVEPEVLSNVLALSDLHIYLTVPFVASWSLFNALSIGCVVLASDVAPVRELIEPGRTGLLEPFYDVDRLTKAALRVLDDPEAHREIGAAARRLIEDRYSLDVCVPELSRFFEAVASGSRWSD